MSEKKMIKIIDTLSKNPNANIKNDFSQVLGLNTINTIFQSAGDRNKN